MRAPDLGVCWREGLTRAKSDLTFRFVSALGSPARGPKRLFPYAAGSGRPVFAFSPFCASVSLLRSETGYCYVFYSNGHWIPTCFFFAF